MRHSQLPFDLANVLLFLDQYTMHNRGDGYVHMLRAAMRGGYIIGSFNLDSLDVMARLVERLEESGSPAVFQFGPWNFPHISPEEVAAGAGGLARRSNRCFVHLDHCPNLDLLTRCVKAGFDSVMFDGSGRALDENIEATREAVRTGHEDGAAVEGSLGQLERGVDTDPEEALRFVEATGVDSLAVAIGTGHGQTREAKQIDLERLQELSELEVPLVIHGGSGLPPSVMVQVRASAAAKLNIATACYDNAEKAVGQWLEENQPGGRASAIAGRVADAFWEVMRERMERMNSLGRTRI
jgi:ketose-bisphosphate aldolase